MIGGGNFAAPLDQGAVGIEEKLGVVQSSAVPFVDADGDDDSGHTRGFSDCVGGSRRHGDCLVEQLPLLRPNNIQHGRLDERKIRVVRNHRFRKRGELHSLPTQFMDLPYDLFDRSFAAIQDRAQLDGSSFHGAH